MRDLYRALVIAEDEGSEMKFWKSGQTFTSMRRHFGLTCLLSYQYELPTNLGLATFVSRFPD